MICIKSVCDFFDIAQGKKQSVQLAGVIAIVNCDREKSDYLFSKNSELSQGEGFYPGSHPSPGKRGSTDYFCSHQMASKGRSVIAVGRGETSS